METKAVFQIKRIQKVTAGLVLLCLLTEDNKRYYNSEDKVVDGLAPFKFTGQRAKILLSGSGCATIDQLTRMVSLGKTTITFDAHEGKKGADYKDLKGNVKQYTQDGWNLLSGEFTFSPTAKAALGAFGERVAMEVAIKNSASEFGVETGAIAHVPVEEEIPSI